MRTCWERRRKCSSGDVGEKTPELRRSSCRQSRGIPSGAIDPRNDRWADPRCFSLKKFERVFHPRYLEVLSPVPASNVGRKALAWPGRTLPIVAARSHPLSRLAAFPALPMLLLRSPWWCLRPHGRALEVARPPFLFHQQHHRHHHHRRNP